MLHPLGQLILARQRPNARFLDFRSDASALTTYTFTDVHLGAEPSFTVSGDVGTLARPRTVSHRAVCIIVHSIDAATLFGVTSMTVGGAAFEWVDRGGATSAVNTAIYVVNPTSLTGSPITISVVHTEAVTGCAIGVVEIDNISEIPFTCIATGSGTSTGSINVGGGTLQSVANSNHNMCTLMGSTCLGTAEIPTFSPGATSGHVAPVMLYNQTTSFAACAAAWAWQPQYPGAPNGNQMDVSWNGASAGDAAIVMFT